MAGWITARGVLLAGIATFGGAAMAADDPLAAYRWKSRLLLVSSPDADDRRVTSQREVAATAKVGMMERDLIIIEVIGSDLAAQRIRNRLKLPKEKFQVVLVGKDGDIKLSRDAPIPTPLLFATIDAMPMRRDESRR